MIGLFADFVVAFLHATDQAATRLNDWFRPPCPGLVAEPPAGAANSHAAGTGGNPILMTSEILTGLADRLAAELYPGARIGNGPNIADLALITAARDRAALYQAAND